MLNPTTWPSYDPVGQQYVRLRGDVSEFPVESHYAAQRMRFWNSFVPALSEECETCGRCDQGDVTSGGNMFHNTYLVIAFTIAFVFSI